MCILREGYSTRSAHTVMEAKLDTRRGPAEYELSIVVPVFNEEDNIQSLANEVFDALAGQLHYELIFVDDGSTDETMNRIGRASAQNGAIVLQAHTQNRGQSAAVMTGVRAARSDLVAVLDGDGQNDPADLPKLLAAISAEPSVTMVIGQRTNRQDSRVKRMSSRIANAIRARVLKDGTRDTGCGIKLFYREQFLRLPAFDHMHRFMPALIQRDGGEIRSVSVNHRPRMSGDSKYGIGNRLWVGIVDMVGVLWLQRRQI